MLKKFLDWFLSTLDLRPIFNRMGGRTMALILLVFFTGTGLALLGRFTVEWGTFAVGLVGVVAGRAALGDKWGNTKTPDASKD
jgi:hypothetical protein